MSDLETFETLIKQTYDLDVVTENLTPDEVELWDSITHMDLCAKLEEAFNINFDVEDISEMESIGQIKAILKRYGVDI